jgi:iron complex outermembrane recepter protein
MSQKFLLIFTCLTFNFIFGQIKVIGKITNANNLPIEGCHIHIGNKNAISNTDGFFEVSIVKKGITKLAISNLAYKSINQILDLQQDVSLTFVMDSKVNILEDIFVSKKRNSENNSILEQKIKLETIEKYSSQTLGDALKEVSGVSILKRGSNIVKPIINGLHSSRVRIISNNVKLEDQEWGSEHAPNFDINSAGKITVVKGAAALQYGGDALGGMVIIEPVVVKKDTLFGKTIANLSSNGKGGTLSSSLHKGNFCDWSWNTQGTFKYYGDRNAPNYVLSNSGNRELNFSADVKYAKTKYDISVFYSLYNAQIGILSASHTGNVNDLYNSINNQKPSVVNEFTYNLKNPKQEVKHHLGKFDFSYYFNESSSLKFQYAYQFNKRLEFDVRRKRLEDTPALDLELKTNALRLDFKNEFDKLKFDLGFNASFQNNIASPLTGVRPLIPDYKKTEFGAYAITNYTVSSNLFLDFGLRYDYTKLAAFKYYFKTRWTERGYDANFSKFIVAESKNKDQWYANPNFVFHNFSGSVGLHKQFDSNTNWFLNVSLATRNPNPSEFFSDGLHHATGQIELGDLLLKKEQAIKFSTTLQQKWNKFSVTINPYINSINNFMYLEPKGFETTIRGAFPVWNYQQTNALLTGLDCNSVLDITKNFKHHFGFAVVNGFDTTNDKPLIAMPPLTFSNKFQFTKKAFYGLVLELKHEVVLQQKQFPDNNFTTPIVVNNELVEVLVDISSTPKAYQLFDFYSEMKFKTFKNVFTTVAFSIQNILNTSYRDYLNSQRFFADELGRNFQIQFKFNY